MRRSACLWRRLANVDSTAATTHVYVGYTFYFKRPAHRLHFTDDTYSHVELTERRSYPRRCVFNSFRAPSMTSATSCDRPQPVTCPAVAKGPPWHRGRPSVRWRRQRDMSRCCGGGGEKTTESLAGFSASRSPRDLRV